ncbi:MAG TPA: hypothetical protein VN229_15040 [Terriglobales bacterium]|nr:hypothetical protein [Terriglobales bacterium]
MTAFIHRSTIVGRITGGIFALGLLAGCAAPMDDPTYPELRFNTQPPIRLNVAAINVTQSYISSVADPYVDQLFPQPPVKAALQWPADRLQAAGADGSLSYDVVNASVTDTKLPRSTGLSSLTTVDQTDRFDLTITVKVSAISGDSTHRGSAQVTVTRAQTINEKTTESERNTVWYNMTRDAMQELDTKLSAQISDNLAWFRQTTN